MHSRVSVIIPAYNRAAVVGRAVRSVLSQTHEVSEVIVVNDGSTDDTARVVKEIADSRVICLEHDRNRNGAAARNSGARRATGEYFAFLDSDDEWLPSHVSNKLKCLAESGCDGVFGSFILRDSRGEKLRRCSAVPAGMSILEYILSPIAGDVRTSSMVLKREAFLAVMFDETLWKHQDWDLAVRLCERFRLSCDQEATVVIHAEGADRMSARMNHTATRVFLDRHAIKMSPAALARMNLILAMRTYGAEGRTVDYDLYRQRAWEARSHLKLADRLVLAAIGLPFANYWALHCGRSVVRLLRHMLRR